MPRHPPPNPNPSPVRTMKTALHLPLLITVAALLIPCGVWWSQAQSNIQSAPVSVRANYRVVDLSKLTVEKGRTAVQSIEGVLNEMAAQGWRLVAISGDLVIFAAD